MNVLLVRDEDINIDFDRSVNILNSICSTIKFDFYKNFININSQTSNINFIKEIFILDEKLSGVERDYIIYITNRKYENNYFYYLTDKYMILSFYGWEHYTNLPLENGLFYFIVDMLVLTKFSDSRHDETTGCIYDFLWDKTGIDIGMKRGYICDDHLSIIRNKIKDSSVLSNIYDDLTKIFNLLSNASRWNKNVLEIDQNQSIMSLDWQNFEDDVANLYRKLGGIVNQNVNLAGFQIDIYVEEETPSKQKIRSAIECKFYRNKVGNKIVNDFYRIIKILKESNLVGKGIIVSYSGFSKDAFLVSKETGIELVHYEDLKHRAGIEIDYMKIKLTKPVETFKEKKITIDEKKDHLPSIFTVMPFSSELDDVYYLGIREIAKELKCSCERVDEIEFVDGILEKIYDSISNSKIIIAEVTSPNPNVFYEIGYAHALEKPVILITKDISTAPFDIRGFNHIIYENIIDLREKLYNRLKVLIETI